MRTSWKALSAETASARHASLRRANSARIACRALSRRQALVHVEAGAMRIQNFHLRSWRSAPAGIGRLQKNSRNHTPEPLPAHGALRGAPAFRVRLIDGLFVPLSNRPLCLCAGGAGRSYDRPPPGFMPRGSAAAPNAPSPSCVRQRSWRNRRAWAACRRVRRRSGSSPRSVTGLGTPIAGATISVSF
jgi:hypothetical protein